MVKIKKEKQLTRREKLRLKTKASAKRFNQEFKKATNIAMVAAFGFIIALSWRDVVTEYINELTAFSPIQGKLFSAVIITIVSVLGILLVTKFFSVDENK